MSNEPIEYDNQWGDPEKIYTDALPRGAKITFATKRWAHLYCIPYDKLDEFIENLTNVKRTKDYE